MIGGMTDLRRTGLASSSLGLLLAALCHAACSPPLDRSGDAAIPEDAATPEDAAEAAAYVGCTYIGALDHMTIAKCAADRGLTFVLELVNPGIADPNFSAPPRWALERAFAQVVASCPWAGPGGQQNAAAAGWVSWPDSTSVANPTRINADATLLFAAEGQAAGLPASERLKVDDLDVARSSCQ